MTPETTARPRSRALASTIDAANAAAPTMTTQPNSSARLAKLAARLPSVPRDAYVVGDVVARGGIGRVMRARDERLDRPVAIKELLTRTDGQERRFIREAMLTARLQHPAIVPVYEAGRWPDGEPFYAMKLVSGRSLAELLEERPSFAERLSLLPHVITVAQAVAYAHSQRVLHRDLKPANVLVGEFGETVVIDWGLAKGLEEESDAPLANGAPALGQEGEGLTIVGAVMGTPAYMPPEQARGDSVDERADIYAIGAMLYHLIAAVPPYNDVPWERLLQTIRDDPPRSLEDVAPAISGELCAIVNKAMARDPAARYSSAKDLADDLHRFQTGQIVAAHTYSSAQLLKRFWRRNRGVLSIAGAALGLVTAVVIGAFIKTDAERRFALEQQKEAQAASIVAQEERRAAESASQQATDRADEMTLLEAQGALSHDPNAAIAWLKTLSPSFKDASEVRRIASDARSRGLSRAFRGHTGHINSVTLVDEGKRFLTASDDKTIRLWDVKTGEGKVFIGHTDEAWGTAVFPDGKRFVSSSRDGSLRIWDMESGATLRQTKTAGPAFEMLARADGSVTGGLRTTGGPWIWPEGAAEVKALAASPETIEMSYASTDRLRVLLQRKDQSVSIFDIATGKETPVPGAPKKRGQWFINADGRAVGFYEWDLSLRDRKVSLWDLSTSKRHDLTYPAHDGQGTFSSPGEMLAALLADTSLEVRSVKTGAVLNRLSLPERTMGVLRFSDDNGAVALGSKDGVVRVWDRATGDVRMYAGLQGAVTALAFLPGQRSVIATSTFGEVRLFEPPSDGVVLSDHHKPTWGLAVSREGRVASIDEGGRLRITDGKGSVVAEHSVEPWPLLGLIASPGKRRFVGTRFEKLGLPWPTEDKASYVFLGTFDATKPTVVATPSTLHALVWHPSEDGVFAGLASGVVLKILTSGSSSEVTRLAGRVTALAVSKDGGTLAIGGEKGLVRLYDLKTGASRELGRHEDRILALKFSGSGSYLASGSLDHTARLWRVAEGSFRSFDASGSGVLAAAFTSDEKELITLSMGEAVLRRWSVSSGEALPSLVGHQGGIWRFELSEDGRRIVTSSSDRSARIFDLSTGRSRALWDAKNPVVTADFTQKGAVVITLSLEGVVRSFSDDLPEAMPELRAWLDAATPDQIKKR